MVRGGGYLGWFIPSLAKNLITILPKAAALYILFQALLPILRRKIGRASCRERV